MKRKDWKIIPAVIRTVYGGNHPRAVLTDKKNNIVWEYVADGYHERAFPGDSPDDCYVWLGAGHRQNFGMYQVKITQNDERKSNSMNAQRLAKAIAENRPLLSHERVYSTCQNDRCTNPKHLKIGDRSDCRIQSGAGVKYTEEWLEENLALLLYSTQTEISATLGLTPNQAGNCKQLAKKWLKNVEQNKRSK